MSRLNNRNKSLSNQMYTEYLKERGLNEITFVSFNKLKKLSDSEKRMITQIPHIWKSGDRYYKLAYYHYGNPSYWWLIALFNNKPTEASVSIGDTIMIPKPLSLLITLFSE